MVLSMRGPEERARIRTQAYGGKFSEETLTDAERSLLNLFKGVWCDGSAITLKAKENTDG
jgi:hypothetical protein